MIDIPVFVFIFLLLVSPFFLTFFFFFLLVLASCFFSLGLLLSFLSALFGFYGFSSTWMVGAVDTQIWVDT